MSDAARERTPAAEHIEVLRTRAAALARVARVERERRTAPYVLFQLGAELYAIAAHVVHQVIVLRDLTPLPGARAPLFGITHWRGDVLTILDLRADLGVQPRGVTDLSRVVVIEGDSAPFGILADAASDFVEIDEDTVRELPSEEMARRSLVRGITDDAVMVVDTDTLLTRYGRRQRTEASTV